MNIVFRADSGRSIGAGHVMRCLSLAAELAAREADVAFICREMPADFGSLVTAAGHHLLRLPPGEFDCSEDAWQTRDILDAADLRPDWLVVDHYGLDGRWEAALRPSSGSLMAIDDLADRSHEADLLLDQNLHGDGFASRYYRMLSPQARILLGPRYALLRPEFSVLRQCAASRDGQVQRILVLYGGADAANQSGKALEALLSLPRGRFEVDVVVGAVHPRGEEIAETCRTAPGFCFHRQAAHVAELMAAADLCLGAGGTATWERCCLGLPTLVTSIADNQMEISESMAQAGCITYLGPASRVSVRDLAQRIEGLMNDPEALRRQSRAARSLVDGAGASRVADVLLQPRRAQLHARPVRPEDSDRYFDWANDPEVRRQSFDSRPISPTDHQQWFPQRLASPDSRLFVIEEVGGEPVGQVRLDRGEDGWQVDYSIAAGQRGRRLAAPAIAAVLGPFWQEFPDAPVLARVKAGNDASNRVFCSLGFSRLEDNDSVVGWRLY